MAVTHCGAAGEEKRIREDAFFGDLLLDFVEKMKRQLYGPSDPVTRCWCIVPLDAVKVMTTILPNMEKAMKPDMTRGAKLVPNTSLKKTVAMSISL